MRKPKQLAERGAEEVALVERMARGDEAALAEIHARFSGMLLALVRQIVGEAEAEDVLQDALVQAWRLAPRYDPRRSSVPTWLVLLARSRAIDRLRTRRVVERTHESAHRDAGSDNSSPHTSQEATAHVLDLERRARVRSALSELPGEQREVIELAYFSGLTQSEIAARTAIPLGTVKTRTLLALRKLRASLRLELRELL